MHLYILFFATLLVGSYSQSISANAAEKSFSRQRREVQEFWNDVINEISDDVNGGSSCVSAVETFVEENPEVLAAVAKRSISKRGVVQFVKKWVNKLNPVKYFYDCAMFLKDKGVEIYNAIEDPAGTEHRITEGVKETAQKLSELYKGSLTNMIQSVDKVKTHLEQSEGNENSDQKALYKTISGVQSKLHSFNVGLRKEDAEKVFLSLMKVIPHVGQSLSSLNWDSLSSLELSSSSETVQTFAASMQHFDLARNILLIMNNASKFYPEFASEENPYGTDLAAGASCITFLAKTSKLKQSTTVTNIEKLQYLEQARKCGTFVTKYTTDDQDSRVKSKVLTGKFLESIAHSMEFLIRLEYYLRIAEKPVEPLTGNKKVLADAVKKIRKYLKSSMTDVSQEFLQGAFDDVVPALNKVEEITSDWSLIKKGGNNVDSTFEPGSQFYRLVNLLNQFSVIPNIDVANSFLKVMSFATLNPFLDTIWF